MSWHSLRLIQALFYFIALQFDDRKPLRAKWSSLAQDPAVTKENVVARKSPRVMLAYIFDKLKKKKEWVTKE